MVVLPLNHQDVITRVLHRFQLHADDVIEIKDTNKEFLVSTTTMHSGLPSSRCLFPNIETHRKRQVKSQSSTSSPPASSSTRH